MNTPARPSLLSRTAQLFAAQLRVYCLSTLVAGALGIALFTAVSLAIMRGAGQGPVNTTALWEAMTFSRQLMAILGLVIAVWMPILVAARGVCRTATDQLAGQPAPFGKILADMARFIPVAFIYSLIIGLPSLIGLFIFIIPGIYCASLFVLVVPVSTNEPSGIFATLRRGVSLSTRVLNKTVLFTFVSGLLVGLLVILRNKLLDRILPNPQASPFVVNFALIYIPALLVLIPANISFTLLYHEARAMEAPPIPGGPPPA